MDPQVSLEWLLQDLNAVLRDFAAAIAAERRCLEDSSGDALPSVTERKVALAARLGELDAQRDRALAARGLPCGRLGIETWLETLPSAVKRSQQALWKSALELATTLKRDNEINGKLIATGLKQTQQTLDVLLGEASGGGTYDADGQRSAKAGRRPLGSA